MPPKKIYEFSIFSFLELSHTHTHTHTHTRGIKNPVHDAPAAPRPPGGHTTHKFQKRDENKNQIKV
ncbi:MAG: hypothetical protein ACOC4M_14525 [Promethearchaeia archaeon]